MYDLPDNTLALYKSHPSQNPIDFSEMPMSVFVEKVKHFYKANPKVGSAENDVLLFYGLNHLLHGLSGRFGEYEYLPADVAKVCEYNAQANTTISARVFLQLACVIQPWYNCGVDFLKHNTPDSNKFKEYLSWRLTPELFQHLMLGRTGGYVYDRDFSNSHFTKFPGTVGDYFMLSHSILAMSKACNLPRWSAIAALGQECVRGAISLMSLTDQTFSIQHYGGSIFIKGVWYKVPDDQKLFHLLDIQDSGQIFKWLSNPTNQKIITPEVHTMFQAAQKYIPDECVGKIDQKLIDQSKKKREGKLSNAPWGVGGFGGAFNAGNGPNAAAPPALNRGQVEMARQNAVLFGAPAKPKV